MRVKPGDLYVFGEKQILRYKGKNNILGDRNTMYEFETIAAMKPYGTEDINILANSPHLKKLKMRDIPPFLSSDKKGVLKEILKRGRIG